MSKSKIVLTHAAYVGGQLRQAGDEVEVHADLAEVFTLPAPDPAAELSKLTKAELLAKATEAGADVTADNNKNEIIEKLLNV